MWGCGSTTYTPHEGSYRNAGPAAVGGGDAFAGAEGVPLPAALESVKAAAKSRFDSWMYQGSRTNRLYRFCQFFVILMLIKKICSSCSYK